MSGKPDISLPLSIDPESIGRALALLNPQSLAWVLVEFESNHRIRAELPWSIYCNELANALGPRDKGLLRNAFSELVQKLQ